MRQTATLSGLRSASNSAHLTQVIREGGRTPHPDWAATVGLLTRVQRQSPLTSLFPVTALTTETTQVKTFPNAAPELRQHIPDLAATHMHATHMDAAKTVAPAAGC